MQRRTLNIRSCITAASAGAGAQQPTGLKLCRTTVAHFGHLLQVSKSAEFFATRTRLQARPRGFYLRCLQFIAQHAQQREQGLPGAWPAHTVGLIFEHTWHHILGYPLWLESLTIPECELYRCSPGEQAKSEISSK